IQQLQTRIRINAPEIIHSRPLEKEMEKLNDINKQLQSTNIMYKNELELVKREFKQLYNDFEHTRLQLNECNTIIDEQRKQNEILKEKLTNTSHLSDVYNNNNNNNKDGIRTSFEIDQSTNDSPQEHIVNLSIDIITTDEREQSNQQTSLFKRDSGLESVTMASTKSTVTEDIQRKLGRKDEQIQELSDELYSSKQIIQVRDDEIRQYRLKIEQQLKTAEIENELRRQLTAARQQIEESKLINEQYRQKITTLNNRINDMKINDDVLNAIKNQLENAHEQNQGLRSETKLLQNEQNNNKTLIEHYKQQIDILEKKVRSVGVSPTNGMAIRTTEMAELLNEMRRLRTDLERSIMKQNELQIMLDENMKQSRTPREFTFSGKGVSHPDLRIIDGSSMFGDIQHLGSPPTKLDDKRTRPIGSSSTEINQEQELILGKMYMVSELENHTALRQMIADIKIELKSIELKLKEKLKSKIKTNDTDWLENRFDTVKQCLQRLEQCYQLVEHYWKAYLPVKDKYNEHPFHDHRLINENKELKLAIAKNNREIQRLRQKCKEQSNYVEEALIQLTVFRPTLDVLTKARTNIEHHLQDTHHHQKPTTIHHKEKHQRYT
ncbi:unnamed protein product, partial [Didymodactylos carnosus]